MGAADQMPGRPVRWWRDVRPHGSIAVACLLVATTAVLLSAAPLSLASPVPPSGPFWFVGPQPSAFDWTRTRSCTVVWTVPDDDVPGNYTAVRFYWVSVDPDSGWIPIRDYSGGQTALDVPVLVDGDVTITGEWKWRNPNDGTSGIVTHTHVLHYDSTPPKFATATMLPASRTTWHRGTDPILYFRFGDNMAKTCLTDVVVSNAKGRPVGFSWAATESQFLTVQGFHQAHLITFARGHLPLGKYTVKVRLHDTAGNVRWSKPVAFKVVK